MSSDASSDEGEIRDEPSGKIEKAKSLAQLDGTSVDRQDRLRPRYSRSESSSNDSSRSSGDLDKDTRFRDRSRSRSPGRARSGFKRHRDEGDHDRIQSDSRRFKVHYEDRAPEQRSNRLPYHDLDRGPSSSSDLRYDERDIHSDYRDRKRSRHRSPYHDAHRGSSHRQNHVQRDYEGRDRSPRRVLDNRRDDRGSRSAISHSVSNRAYKPESSESAKREAKTMQGTEQINQSGDGIIRKDFAHTLSEIDYDAPVIDEATLIEERRKKREAIKAKYKDSAPSMLVQALQSATTSLPNVTNQTSLSNFTSSRSESPAGSVPGTPSSPGTFAITNDKDLTDHRGAVATDTEDDGPSAADYDPTMDMREDRDRDDHRHLQRDVLSSAYDEIQPSIEQDVLIPSDLNPVETQTTKAIKDDLDMFASEDEDDMFAEASMAKTDDKQVLDGMRNHANAVAIPEARELDIGMLDNWDDPEGYYKIILGELLNGRYHVQSNLGQGMFSGVVRALDITSKKIVAIKLIRNNETMRKAGMKEIRILQQLNDADQEDKKHLIRLERHFEHKGHLCMVFENLSINLREVLKKFGRDVGINLKAVRAYAQQMFLGLSLMRKCSILHADLKPDNILVNETRNVLKICDLGSASDSSDNEITPYLVSRFYRAPEIILGMPYDFAIDMWSIGCTLYELYTGKILFTGRTNNQMLRSIMECRGKFTTKMLRRAQFAYIHFDEVANFLSAEQDKLTGKNTIKTLSFAKPIRDLRMRLVAASKGLSEEETKDLNLFADLLDRCLALNPEKRCTPAEALKHPFISRLSR